MGAESVSQRRNFSTSLPSSAVVGGTEASRVVGNRHLPSTLWALLRLATQFEKSLRWLSRWRTLVPKALATNLRTLNVIESNFDSIQHPLTFLGFTHLEHLTVPAASIVFFGESPYLWLEPALHGIPDPTTALPGSLKSHSLFVRDHIWERGHTLRWLSDLFLSRTDKPFPTLQRVQLYFTNTLVKFRRILNHHASDDSAFDSTLVETDGQRAITRIFQTHNVDLELFFLKREKSVFGVKSTQSIDMYDRSNYHRVCHKHAL
jgi:hypothetical protein